jgi:hypothetical protein
MNILSSAMVQKWCNPSNHYDKATSREFKQRTRMHLTGRNGTLQKWPLHMRINYRAGCWIQRDFAMTESQVQKIIPSYTTSLYPAPFTASW